MTYSPPLDPSSKPARILVFLCLLAGAGLGPVRGESVDEPADPWISPSALTLTHDGRILFVASATSGQVLVLDAATLKVVQTLPVPDAPSGLALSPDDRQLLVTCSAPESTLRIIDWREGRVVGSVPLGSGAMAPVLSLDGRTAYVCMRFEGAVSVVDLSKGTETRRFEVEREPVALALTPDGRHLLVANHLPIGRADAGGVAAHVTVIDVLAGQVVRQIALPNGGNLVRDVRVSPDGRHACVTHTLARFQLPTTQVERGWMNCSALTLIDLASLSVVNTVLLDQIEHGAANPWGAAWSADGRSLLVTHAGTHELSVIDFPGLLQKLARLPQATQGRAVQPGYVVSRVVGDVSGDLSFLRDLRQSVRLGGNGPRAIALHGSKAYVGHYFSENISVVDLTATPAKVAEIPLHPPRPMTVLRRGEALFNDATLCLESWQSCASCHSSEARVDALNWDLMNDGKGNSKNTKSLLYAHLTAPAMSLGIRDNAEVAVRSGIHHILFTLQPEEVPAAIDQWIASLKGFPSPHRVRGGLSPAAERGRVSFNDPATHCSECHPPPLYTNREGYAVGTRALVDRPIDLFDTPTLLEVWRTGPYLHDGSAATLREVLQERNVGDLHGKTSHLTPAEISDLVAFLLSL